MRKSFLIALSFATLLGLMAVPVMAKSAPVEVSNKALTNMTWDVFAGGCIENADKLANWAGKQIYVRKAKIDDKSKIAGLWKNLGYPVPDKIIDMWGTIGKRVWLYQHENKGCTVTSYADVSPQMIENAFDNIGQAFKAKNKMSYNVTSSKGKNAAAILLVLGQEQKVKTYILARILPTNKTGIKTIFYQFKSDKNVNL